MKNFFTCVVEAAGDDNFFRLSNFNDSFSDEDWQLLQEAADIYAEQSNSHKPVVMQAEVSDGAEGAAVGQRSGGTVAERMEVINIKTGQLLSVEGYGFMFGKDLNTGEIKCFNIDNVSEPPSGEQP